MVFVTKALMVMKGKVNWQLKKCSRGPRTRGRHKSYSSLLKQHGIAAEITRALRGRWEWRRHL